MAAPLTAPLIVLSFLYQVLKACGGVVEYYPNDIGHDEYLHWIELTGAEPLYTVNLGTGDINDAIGIIEYTNHEGGTYWLPSTLPVSVSFPL